MSHLECWRIAVGLSDQRAWVNSFNQTTSFHTVGLLYKNMWLVIYSMQSCGDTLSSLMFSS